MNTKNGAATPLTATDKAEILTAIQTMRSKMPFMVNLTIDDRRHLRKTGTKRMGYVHDVSDAVKTHPDAMPVYFDTAEFIGENLLYTQMTEINSALSMLLEEVDDTCMYIGASVIGKSDIAYGALKLAGKKNSTTKSSVEKISAAFKKQVSGNKLKKNATDKGVSEATGS